MNFKDTRMGQWPLCLVFREIHVDQWPLKFVKSFPRNWYWSMDGSSQNRHHKNLQAWMDILHDYFPEIFSTVCKLGAL